MPIARMQDHKDISLHPEASGNERALLIAADLADKIKVREVGINRGFWVQKFLASVGLGGGYAWCAAFVYWCLASAGVPKASLPSRAKGYNPASVNGWWMWAKDNDRLTTEPERGDLFFWLDSRKGSWQGHIGWFVRFTGPDTFATIEGNTNAKGSRDGDGAYRKDRSKADMRAHEKYGFIRLKGLG